MADKKYGMMHMALSTDVDRFDDKYLMKHFDNVLVRNDGSRIRWFELKKMCVEARAQGLEVFPPCDNVTEKGHCAGHPPKVDEP